MREKDIALTLWRQPARSFRRVLAALLSIHDLINGTYAPMMSPIWRP